ncbi:hypothetical protein HBI73_147110 [Parastagonospora nodorum]|nr:hypothetical protein HBI73_147110 [Parastagonospora nodorum]
MNRDLRPYYPPNHKDEVLTDGEMRRRAEVAAYMANEQKVKHRLKRIRFVRDRANAEGLLFSPTLLSSFTGTPEERVQIMQDLATIERGRRTSIYPFTHFMPSWPSLSAHEQQYARNTVCAINEAAIAPTHFKNDLIRKRFENGEQQFRKWWNTSHMTGEERELYKRAIREINVDAQGWHYRGSKVRPLSTGVDPLEATDADRLARFVGTVERLRREGLGVPENIWGWGEVAPERRHRVWWELERMDAGGEVEVEPLTEEQRLMMLTNDREALVVAGLDAPENLLSWGSMTGEERDQIRRDWESLDEQVRMMDGRK